MLSFGKKHRLRAASDFRRVYRSGYFGNTEHHRFNVAANQQGVSRLGVAVSTRVSRRAVNRNRLRRQIKEFYRLHQHQIREADLVVTAKPSCATATDEQRAASLEQLWTKLMKWQHWYRTNRESRKPGEPDTPTGKT